VYAQAHRYANTAELLLHTKRKLEEHFMLAWISIRSHMLRFSVSFHLFFRITVYPDLPRFVHMDTNSFPFSDEFASVCNSSSLAACPRPKIQQACTSLHRVVHTIDGNPSSHVYDAGPLE
jgi:hypothetical protein